MRQLGFEVAWVQPNSGQWRRGAQRLIGGVADPARELRSGGHDLPLGESNPVVDQRDRRASSKRIGLRAAPAAVGGVRCLDLQIGLGPLGSQHLKQAFLEMTFQPSRGGVATQVGKRQRARCLRGFGFAVVACRARRELVAAGELLHHADRTHGHEIARQAEPVGAADRQVVQAHAERRVGPLAGCHGPLARRRRRSVVGRELT